MDCLQEPRLEYRLCLGRLCLLLLPEGKEGVDP